MTRRERLELVGVVAGVVVLICLALILLKFAWNVWL
jgi:hypothetical protein